MKRALLAIFMMALTGCTDCEQRFKVGDFVTHKIAALGKMIVIRSSEVENYEGSCLVTVRDEQGRSFNVVSAELEPTPVPTPPRPEGE